MDKQTPQLLLSNIWKSARPISLWILAIAAVSMLLFLYFSCNQQRNDLETANMKLLDQNEQTRALRADFEALKQQISEQKSLLISQKNQVDKTTQELSTTNDDLRTTREETSSLKKVMNDWQKDYVTTLLKVEEKTDGARNSITDLNKQYDDINEQLNSLKAQANTQDVPGLREEVKNLKYVLDQMLSALPAGAPTTQSIQRQIHPAVIQQPGISGTFTN